mmetsp:Transcript_54479/g.126835  ORF Transcript_54479/g.126835 Transcript_54479/m.126835 type:complete len:206 (-) Transcript_54479:820-1437(-)
MTTASPLWRVQDRLNCEDARKEIQKYCEAAALKFNFTPEQLVAEGGEGYDHQHEWHDLHKGFDELIERLLADALALEGIDRATFVAECKAALDAKEKSPSMLCYFLSMLLESGDYRKFVELMKLQCKLRAQAEACPPCMVVDEEGGEDEEDVEDEEVEEEEEEGVPSLGRRALSSRRSVAQRLARMPTRKQTCQATTIVKWVFPP